MAKHFDGRQMPTYQILLGGKAALAHSHFGQKAGMVPAARVPQAVERIARYFLERKQDREDFSGFVQRVGIASFEKCLSDLIPLPLYQENPARYRDIGEQQEYRIRARRGECSA